MIRELQVEEMMDVVGLLMDQAEQWSHPVGLEADIFTVKCLLRVSVAHENRLAVVNDRMTGIGLAMEFEWPMDLRRKEVHELVTTGESKRELREYIDDWARDRGSEVVIISCLEDTDEPRVRRV